MSAIKQATPNYFDVLGVSMGASDDQVKVAYRKLAKERHPDTGGNAEQMKEINAAYEKLKTKAGRHKHRRELSEQSAEDTETPPPSQGARNPGERANAPMDDGRPAWTNNTRYVHSNEMPRQTPTDTHAGAPNPPTLLEAIDIARIKGTKVSRPPITPATLLRCAAALVLTLVFLGTMTVFAFSGTGWLLSGLLPLCALTLKLMVRRDRTVGE